MTDEDRIVARILDVIPPRSLELTTFFSLFRVRFSDEVETACVTCGASPELLLNHDFVETHCRTGEHLFMLVMHELYHVILGHTTLFPHATRLSNIVFDAVINALLCSLFPKPEFTSFFTDYYPADRMPFALLRPKAEGGWSAAYCYEQLKERRIGVRLLKNAYLRITAGTDAENSAVILALDDIVTEWEASR